VCCACVRAHGGSYIYIKSTDVPLLVAIDEPWCDRADVCTGADEQKDDEQQGLEIEKRRLRAFECVSV